MYFVSVTLGNQGAIKVNSSVAEITGSCKQEPSLAQFSSPADLKWKLVFRSHVQNTHDTPFNVHF